MTPEVSSGPLSKCNYCGYIFPSRILEITSSTNVSLTNVKEPCPKCGETAQVLDGIYNFDVQGIAELVSSSAFTKEIYDRFRKLVERVKEENIGQEDFIKEVEEISPSLALSIKKYLPNDAGSLIALLTLLWTIFTYDGSNDDKKSQNTYITNNYYQNPQPSVVNVVGYNRNFNLKRIYPKEPAKEIILEKPTGIEVHKNIEQNKNTSKKKSHKKRPIKPEQVKIDTSTCDSTKETIKRLLKGK